LAAVGALPEGDAEAMGQYLLSRGQQLAREQSASTTQPNR
jgi:hypothetical protein